MAGFNDRFARLVDWLLIPFQDQPPIAGIAVASLFVALLTLTIVRLTSNRTRIIAVRRALHACLLEIRLFNHDVLAMWRAVGEMIRHQLTYLVLSAVTIVCVSVPVGLLAVQLQFHFGYDGLRAGQAAIVKVRLRESAAERPVLIAPDGVRVETPGVWIRSLREVAWRVVVDRPGDYVLTVRVGGESFTKTLRASTAIVRRSPERSGTGILHQVTAPSERPLPDRAPLESIVTSYPARDISVLGQHVHWTVVFFVLSVLLVFALRRPFKVVL